MLHRERWIYGARLVQYIDNVIKVVLKSAVGPERLGIERQEEIPKVVRVLRTLRLYPQRRE